MLKGKLASALRGSGYLGRAIVACFALSFFLTTAGCQFGAPPTQPSRQRDEGAARELAQGEVTTGITQVVVYSNDFEKSKRSKIYSLLANPANCTAHLPLSSFPYPLKMFQDLAIAKSLFPNDEVNLDPTALFGPRVDVLDNNVYPPHEFEFTLAAVSGGTTIVWRDNHNHIYSCYDGATPPSPSPNPQPPQLSVSDPASTAPPSNSIAFSPVHPGITSPSTKNVINLDVVDSVPWQVTAVDTANPTGPGYVIATGQPGGTADKPLVQPWNGSNGSGIILKDGTYTLRLIAQGASPGSNDPTANVIIDTIAPSITDMSFLDARTIRAKGSQTLVTYEIAGGCRISDIGLAGIDQSKIKISVDGTSATDELNNFDASTGVALYGSRVSLPGGSRNITLRFSASDKAGNQTTVLKTFSLSGSAEHLGGGGGAAISGLIDLAMYFEVRYGLQAFVRTMPALAFVNAVRLNQVIQEILSEGQFDHYSRTGVAIWFKSGGYSAAVRDIEAIAARIPGSKIVTQPIVYRHATEEIKTLEIKGVGTITARSFSAGTFPVGGGEPTLDIRWAPDALNIARQMGLQQIRKETKFRYNP